jgi:hypothetical protein
MNKLNNIRAGLIAGILAPLLFLLILWMYADTSAGFFNFLAYLFEMRLLGNFTKLALLFNLALFILFNSRNKLQFCKGILSATILWGLFIVYMYFF